MIFSLFGGEKKRIAEMIAVARAGDTEKVKQLLSKGVDINASEPESGDTPLLAAIDKGRWATAEYLLTQKPDLTREDKNGNSALYLAVSHGDSALGLAKQLLRAGAPVDLGPSKGEQSGATPLHVCCAKGANECLEALLAGGASVAKKLPDGSTPLHTAAIGGDQRTVELLCKAGASVTALSNDKRTPLHNCGITGNAKVAAALIEHGAEVDGADAEGCTPLMRAVLKNHPEVARVVLDHGANPNVVVQNDDSPLYPLFIAAMNGYDDVVRVLLDKGVDVMAKVPGSAAPVDAAKHNGHEVAAKLISAAIKRKKAEAKAEKEGSELQSQLEQAWKDLDGEALRKIAESRLFSKLPAASRLSVLAVTGDLAGVNGLLASGLNPDLEVAPTTAVIPPVVAASMRKGNVDVVRALLAAGANLNVMRADGSSALLIASSNGDTEAVRVLLEADANPNHALPNGQTVLMSAAVNGQAKVVDLLIDAGADVNAIFPEGRLGAFGLALDSKKMRVALQLLRRGAQPSFGDSDTLPLAVAEYGSLELLQELDARGGLNLAAFGARAAFVAARNKDPEVLDYLLSQGVDLSSGNDLDYTPLILASVANHPSLVQRYVDRGDDLNSRDIDGETALSLAIEKDLPLVIHILRTANAETRDFGDLPIAEAMFRASSEGALGTILDLRDRGASINCLDGQGNTPLMLAAKAGFVGVVRSLYHLGADINHKNLTGESASNLAKQADQIKVLKTLMEFGAEDALQDVYGINPPDGEESSRKTIAMVDTLMGRYSHPFKDKLPYDAAEKEDDSTEEDDSNEEAVSDDVEDADVALSDEVSSMLDLLEELIDKPHIQEKLADSNREVLTQRVHLIRSEGEKAVPKEQLVELFKLVEFFQEQPEAEELPPPLFEAATEGDLKQFRKLIKAGANVKETLPDGTTLLMKAAENGHIDIIQELIKLDVDVNQRRQDTFSALLMACFSGHDDVVKTLAKHGADINAAYEIGSSQGSSGNQTALTVAAARGNCPMCALLLKLGADLNVVSDSGYTPVMWSLANGSSEDAAELLLKAGANPDPDAESRIAISTSTTPLILAATNGMAVIVKALLKRQVAVNKADGDGWTALKHASNEGHKDVVALLLKAGASPNVADREGWTPLINAAGKGHFEICKALLKAGADVNATGARGRTPLLQAIGARTDNRPLEEAAEALAQLARVLGVDDDEEDDDVEPSSIDLVKVLLKAGANPNAVHDGASLLSAAIENDDAELVKLLKKHGAAETVPQSSASTSGGATPESEEGQAFLVAAMQADTKALRELVLAGVDVNYTSPQGLTALGILLAGLHDESKGRLFRRNAEQCLDYLLSHGADPGRGDPSPFVLAAMGRRLHLLQAMLANGVDVNQSIGEGQTALFMALLAPDAGKPIDDRCALALLNAEADSSIKHESGAMPIHLAAASNYLGALQALLEGRPQDVDAKTNIGITPLMMAATEGHAQAVQLLLKFGADCSLRNDKGLTAKEVAIKNGNADLVPLLISQQRVHKPVIEVPNVAVRDGGDAGTLGAVGGETTQREEEKANSLGQEILAAALAGQHEKAGSLLRKGANPLAANEKEIPAFLAPALTDNLEMQRIFLQSGVSPALATDPGGVTALMVAAARGSKDICDVLLDAGADVNQLLASGEPFFTHPKGIDFDMPALGCVVDAQKWDLAAHLLSRGAKPEFGVMHTDIALTLAKFAPVSLVEQMHQAGYSVVMDHEFLMLFAPPLEMQLPQMRSKVVFWAAANPDAAVLPWVLAHGGDPLAGNSLGMTPLMVAAAVGNTPLVEELLSEGADPAAQDCDGDTALSLAVERGHKAAVAALRRHMAPVDPADRPVLTLHQAAAQGDLCAVLDRLDQGVSPNLRDEEDCTALMRAAQAGQVAALRILFAVGGSVRPRNAQGKSAWDLGQEASDKRIRVSLKEFNADDPKRKDDDERFDALERVQGRYAHPFKYPGRLP